VDEARDRAQAAKAGRTNSTIQTWKYSTTASFGVTKIVYCKAIQCREMLHFLARFDFRAFWHF